MFIGSHDSPNAVIENKILFESGARTGAIFGVDSQQKIASVLFFICFSGTDKL